MIDVSVDANQHHARVVFENTQTNLTQIQSTLQLYHYPVESYFFILTIIQAEEMLSNADSITIVDTREPALFCREGHIPKALNYPWETHALQDRYDELSLENHILITGQTGEQSRLSADFLADKGFTLVYDMGEFDVWEGERKKCCAGIGLSGAITALQIAVHLIPENIDMLFDVDGDQYVSLAEVICILKANAGFSYE